MTQATETLGTISVFQSLPATQVRHLDTQCIWHRASPNEWIIDYQDESSDVLFVVSGTVKVKIQSASGQEVMLREINAGELFAELTAIDDQPRSSSIIAETNAVIARMPAAVFRATVHAFPDVCDQVLRVLTGQIRMLENRVNEFATLDVRHRIYAELLRLARPAPDHSGRAIISPPPVHAEIAALVSTRREAVARELKSLERCGLIARRRGAIELMDVDKIRRMTEDPGESI
jgi:CRP/FNR family cyclic AMP-dependent transcriptional regulator